jgi:hypothetical protein
VRAVRKSGALGALCCVEDQELDEGALFDAKNELGDTLRDIAALAAKVGAMAADKALQKGEGVAARVAELQAAGTKAERALEEVQQRVTVCSCALGRPSRAALTRRTVAHLRRSLRSGARRPGWVAGRPASTPSTRRAG